MTTLAERTRQQNTERDNRAARRGLNNLPNFNMDVLFDPPLLNEPGVNQPILIDQNDDQVDVHGENEDVMNNHINPNTLNESDSDSSSQDSSLQFNSAVESPGDGLNTGLTTTANETLTDNPSNEPSENIPLSSKGKPMIKCPYCLAKGTTKWVEQIHGMKSHIRSAHRELAAIQGLASTPATTRINHDARLIKDGPLAPPLEGEGL